MSHPPHPTLPGIVVPGVAFGDAEHRWPKKSSVTKHTSPYLDVEVDTIIGPDGAEHDRTVVRPHGAVGVVAIDEDDRILLVEQYRHPVGRRLVEIPAGTLDVAGETPQVAAARELSEEADVQAAEWTHLLGLFATPGYSTETWTIYTASGLTATPMAERIERVAEEADMRQLWVPFADALSAALAGAIGDSMTVAGILATDALRRAGA